MATTRKQARTPPFPEEYFGLLPQRFLGANNMLTLPQTLSHIMAVKKITPEEAWQELWSKSDKLRIRDIETNKVTTLNEWADANVPSDHPRKPKRR